MSIKPLEEADLLGKIEFNHANTIVEVHRLPNGQVFAILSIDTKKGREIISTKLSGIPAIKNNSNQ